VTEKAPLDPYTVHEALVGLMVLEDCAECGSRIMFRARALVTLRGSRYVVQVITCSQCSARVAGHNKRIRDGFD